MINISNNICNKARIPMMNILFMICQLSCFETFPLHNSIDRLLIKSFLIKKNGNSQWAQKQFLKEAR